jgi:hypothetical protein
VARARLGTRAFARAVPVWAWLAGIVLLSAGIRVLLAGRMPAPWIMVDELIYSELAKSFAAHGRFLISGVPVGTSFGPVYPVLISPAYRLFSAVPDAYDAVKAINSLLMSSAAVPAYFLARRVLTESFALLAAVMAVAIPSMLYTGTVMTENAFYPVFICVALALVAMLERPTHRRQLLVLALCLVAYKTRQQALALFPAVLTAPLLLGRRGLGRFRMLYGTAAGVLCSAVFVEAARGRTPLALLGAYEVAGRHAYSAGEVAKWLLWHLSELDLYLGVVPAAAFVVLALSWRTLEPAQRAFMAAASALSFWMILEVAAFASLPIVDRIEERNMFYVAPFFLIALLLLIQRGLPRPRLSAPLVAVGAALLVAVLPFSKLIGVQATADTFALLPWWKLEEQVITPHQVRTVVVLAALIAAAAFLAVPQRYALALPLFVLVYFAVAQAPIEARASMQSRGALFEGVGAVPPDWIDRSVPKGADVALIWTGKPNIYVVWENEFFNRKVGNVYVTGSAIPGGLPSTALTVGRDGYLRDSAGDRIRARYVLVDDSLDLVGVKLASSVPLGVNLWDARRPVRSRSLIKGLYPNDTWSSAVVEYRQLGCSGGSVRVGLIGDPNLFRRAQTVRAAGVTQVVQPGVPATMTVPLTNCSVRFRISPTKVPGPQDLRRLGLHFMSFDYVPNR